MSLIINGVTIPEDDGSIFYNGTELDKVVCNGVTVWEKVVFTEQEFSYTGGVQVWTCPTTGVYKLEVWGAKGADVLVNRVVKSEGGYGGYCYGNARIEKGSKLYICCGGAGDNCDHGYNGGGYKSANEGIAGGGATHIALNTNRGELQNYASHTSEILIVAGGGGGGDFEDWDLGRGAKGGHGGGLSGQHGTDSIGYGSNFCGKGGTQTSGGQCDLYPYIDHGAFGKGSPFSIFNGLMGGAGGGGWYGGSAGNGDNGCHGGGGGSSYYGSLSSAGTTIGANQGHGKAKITFVSK